MKFFDPERTHEFPSAIAVVRVPFASLPAPASVRPQAPISFPSARGTTQRRRRSSEPKRKMWFVQRLLCAAIEMPTEPSTRDSSSITLT